jgi:branched-subunit amino acid transport protein
MTTWLIILCMGIVTYGIRLLPIALLGRIELPPIVLRALRFVPPAVLSAIFFPELLRPAGPLDISWGNARLIAGLLAAVIAWRTKSVLVTIAVGMIVLWVLTTVGS